MVNFQRLKKLITEFEQLKEAEQKDFFSRLKVIAEIELNIRQAGLGEYFK